MENTIYDEKSNSEKNGEFSILKTCGFCEHFSPKIDENGRVRRYGVCRCHSPNMDGFPWVYNDDWCAERVERLGISR